MRNRDYRFQKIQRVWHSSNFKIHFSDTIFLKISLTGVEFGGLDFIPSLASTHLVSQPANFSCFSLTSSFFSFSSPSISGKSKYVLY